MKTLDESILNHFEELVKTGRDLSMFIQNSGHSLNSEKASQVSSWLSRSGQLIKTIYTEDSLYYQHFNSIIKSMGNDFYNLHSSYNAHFGTVLGCLVGAYEDYKNNLLGDVRNILRAEIFGDFLEMASYLLENGYKDAAAVIIGSVLEDSLRKISVKNRVPIKNNNDKQNNLEKLNQDLYSAKVYDKLICKQITSWGDLRNKAAHGEYAKFDADQVNMMKLFVEKFCSDFIN